jgi:ParB family transcriptional regulator, chromosome partitioning protein
VAVMNIDKEPEQLELIGEDESVVHWVPLTSVIPNPLNPRRDDSVESEVLSDILKKRGWEEPLTCYQAGKMYVLLAGHRRLYAARKAKVRKIPVYIVSKPKDEAEEIERIAGLQSARVDWQPLEWAIFTWDRWNAWGKPPYTRFAKEINISIHAVKQYITVMGYFPLNEIEKELQSKNLNMSSLDALVKWITALKKHKPELVETMTEDMIRKVMLQKLVNKKALRDDLRNTEYCELAKEEQIKEFLIDKDMELDAQIGYMGIKRKYKDFTGHLISMGHFSNRIPHIKPETEHQRSQAVAALDELAAMIEQKKKEIMK